MKVINQNDTPPFYRSVSFSRNRAQRPCMHSPLLSWESLDGHDLSVALPGTYDPFLVALSVVLASLAAYVALELAERISAAHEPGAKRLRLAAGAATMG